MSTIHYLISPQPSDFLTVTVSLKSQTPCYDSDKLVDLLITYLNERTQKHQSIFLTAFVAENAPLDLIIGRSTIKKTIFILVIIVTL